MGLEHLLAQVILAEQSHAVAFDDRKTDPAAFCQLAFTCGSVALTPSLRHPQDRGARAQRLLQVVWPEG